MNCVKVISDIAEKAVIFIEAVHDRIVSLRGRDKQFTLLNRT